MRNFIAKIIVFTVVTSCAYSEDSSPTKTEKWYRGCYLIPEWLNATKMLTMDELIQLPNIKPATCAAYCLDTNEKLFALLWNGNMCFCSNSIIPERKTDDASCDIRCKEDNKVFCGGQSTASVYSVHGPYVSSMDVVMSTNSAEPFETIRFTVSIKLASSYTTPTGVPAYGGFDLGLLKLSANLENNVKTHTVRAVRDAAKFALEYRFSYTGINILDFDACNSISCVSYRHYITIATLYPDRLRWAFVNSYIPRPSCVPRELMLSGITGYSRSEISVFVGMSLTFRASVAGGSDLTFEWKICDKEVRRVARYLKDTSCEVTKCRHDEQKFLFKESGVCRIDLSVWNRYGMINDTFTLVIISPEMSDLDLSLIEGKEGADYSLLTESAVIPPWQQNNRWNTGLDNSYYGESTTELEGFSRFNDAPYSAQGGGWLDMYESEIPAPESAITESIVAEKYKVGDTIYFQATMYITSISHQNNITVKFGDGHLYQEKITPDRRPTRMKRSIMATDGFDPYKILDENEDETNPMLSMAPRSGEFFIPPVSPSSQQNISASFTPNSCQLNFNFEHVYKTGGVYNVTIEVTNGTHHMLSFMDNQVEVIEEQNNFNITCPEYAIVGESVRFDTSVNDLSIDYYIWIIKKILKDDSSDISEEIYQERADSSHTTFDTYMKESFEVPGLYQIVVNAHRMDLSKVTTQCFIEVQVSISNLTVFADNKSTVETNREINITAHITEGSSPIFQWIGPIFESDISRNKSFNVIMLPKPICYTWSLSVRNKVSQVDSTIYTICGEDAIRGLKIDAPDQINVKEISEMLVHFTSGTNVKLVIRIVSLTGETLAEHFRNNLDSSRQGVSITLPQFKYPGKFKIIVTASNRVSRESCHAKEFSIIKYLIVGQQFIKEQSISLQYHLLKNSEYPNGVTEKLVVMVAKINLLLYSHMDVVYTWTIQRETKLGGVKKTNQVRHYSGSPLLKFNFFHCSMSQKAQPITWNLCKVSVKATTQFSELHSSKTFIKPELEQQPLFIIPYSGFTQTGSSTEIDVICYPDPVGNVVNTCEISFGDGSTTMDLASNANWNKINHAFVKVGLYEIKMKHKNALLKNEEKTINSTFISVQEKISNAILKGTSDILIETNSTGSWKVAISEGSNVVYHWTLLSKGTEEDTLVYEEYVMSQDIEYTFSTTGIYVMVVEAFNDINKVELTKHINVKSSNFSLHVKVGEIFVEKEVSFIITTNATTQSSISTTLQPGRFLHLECLETAFANGHQQYIIKHKFSKSGPVFSSFYLTFPNNKESPVATYKLNFNVKAKEEEKQLTLTINGPVSNNGKVYVIPVKKQFNILASTNFYTSHFHWVVTHKEKSTEKVVLTSEMQSYNDSKSNLEYSVTDKGYYLVTTTSYPSGLNTSMIFIAEEPISRLRLNYPYSPQLNRYFSYCELKKQENGELKCDNLTLSARCDGSHIFFALNIKFKPVPEDAVLQDFDTVTTRGTIILDPNLAPRFTYETEINYSFKREGTYHINITAYNHLSTLTTSVSGRNWDPAVPFVFYAQRAPTGISFPESVYYAEVGMPILFQLDREDQSQSLSVDWNMGDGILKERGFMISYIFTELTPNNKPHKVYAKAYNKIGTKRTPTILVHVLERLHYVYLEQPIGVFSTEEGITLTAFVNTSQAHKFYWHAGLNKPVETYDNSRTFRFQEAGIYPVKVIADNHVSVVESNMITLVIEEKIQRVSFYGESVVLRNHAVMLEIKALLGSNIKIQWKIEDGKEFEGIYKLNHTFNRVGVYNVRVQLMNSLNKVIRNKRIFVVERMCELPEISFTNQLLSHERSKTLIVELETSIQCSYLARLEYQWMAYKNQDGSYCTENIRSYIPNYLEHFNTNEKTLLLPPNSIEYGSYCLAVNVSVLGSNIYKIQATEFTVEESQLVAFIKGPKLRQVARQDIVTIDASLSHDPDFPENKRRLKFEWECFILDIPNKPCFIPGLVLSGNSSSNNMRADLPYMLENGYYSDQPDLTAYKTFPPDITRNKSVLTFSTDRLDRSANSFIFKVIVAKGKRRHYETAVLTVSDDDEVKKININCPECYKFPVVRESSVIFEGSCDNCGETESVSYHWSLQEVEDASSKSFHQNETSDCAPPDGSGWVMRMVGGHTDNRTTSENNFVNYTHIINTPDKRTDDKNFTGVLVPEEMLNADGSEITENSPLQSNDLLVQPPEDIILNALTPDSLHDTALDQHSQDDAILDQHLELSRLFQFNSYGVNQNGESNLRSAPDETSYILQEGAVGPRAFNYFPYTIHENENQYPHSNQVQQNYPDGYTVVSGFAPRNGIIYNSGSINDHIPAFEQRGTGTPSSGDFVFDAFIDGESKALPVDKHYQDMKHESVDLKSKAANGIHNKNLVLKPNVLKEGKTYALKLMLTYRDSNGKIKTTNATYYFTVERGPSYGECSVVDEKYENKFRVHCAQWQNNQKYNDNSISSREMLRYEISYSLTSDGEKRFLYYGVGFEKQFQLPNSTKEKYIHISLSNANGATTNVCSFPTNTSKIPLSNEEKIDIAFNLTVPVMSGLNKDLARQDKESVLARSNVVMDTLPKMPSNISHNGTLKVYAVIEKVVDSLQDLKLNNFIEIQHVTALLSRILKYMPVTKPNVIIKSGNILQQTCTCANKIILSNKERILLHQLKTVTDKLTEIKMLIVESIKRIEINMGREKIEFIELVQTIKELDEVLQEFMINGAIRKHNLKINPHSARSTEYGISVSQLKPLVILFNSTNTTTEKWNIGAVFPDDVVYNHENHFVSMYAYLNNSLPLSYYPNSLDHQIPNIFSVSIWNKDGVSIPVRNLHTPIVISLPAHSPKKVEERFLQKEYITEHRFDVSRKKNKTLHVEIDIDTTNNSPFPLTIIMEHNGRYSAERKGVQHENALRQEIVTRNNYLWAKKQNKTIKLKWALQGDQLNYGVHSIIIKNQEFMRPLSIHKDDKKIPYRLNIWWADCVYWNATLQEWRSDDVTVLKESSHSQTLCETKHLTVFTSTYEEINDHIITRRIETQLSMTALPGCLIILILVVMVSSIILCCNHKYLQPLDSEPMRNNTHGIQKENFLMSKMRWYFGPERKAAENCTPVILPENKPTHAQKFEITVKTGSQMGSGTTSTANVILYGQNGKYDARELISQKMHKARELKFEQALFHTHESEEVTGDEELLITGSSQTFVTTFPKSLGPLWKVVIWHDNSGDHPSWFLDCIIVKDITYNEDYFFPCHKHLTNKLKGCSIQAELKPVIKSPGVVLQLLLFFKIILNNCHSLVSIVTSPSYGPLTRFQRIVHIFSKLFLIMALSLSNHLLDWDSFSADTDLPYFHLKSVLHGAVIGIIAWFIFFFPQLILRYSKREERISVTMEDITSSGQGSQLIEDYTPFPSSVTLKPMNNELESFKDALHLSGKYDEINRITGIINDYPSAEDIVYDWLELKAGHEDKNRYASCNTLAGPEITMQSMTSFDEEIARCMAPSRHRTFQVEASIENNDKAFEDASKMGRCFSSVSAGFENYTEKAADPYSDDIIEFDKVSMNKTVLAMDGPELVPFAKLEPIPELQSAPLPKFCTKIVLLYCGLMCTLCAGIIIYTSTYHMYYMDFGPWLEKVLCSFLITLCILEPFLLFVYAMVKFLALQIKRISHQKKLKLFCEFVYSSENQPVSLAQYGGVTLNPNFESTNALVTDEEVAKEIADRERSRYLRYAKPPPHLKTYKGDKTNISLDILSRQWFQLIGVIFIVLLFVSAIGTGIWVKNQQTTEVKYLLDHGMQLRVSDYSISVRPVIKYGGNAGTFRDVKSNKDFKDWLYHTFSNIEMISQKSTKTHKPLLKTTGLEIFLQRTNLNVQYYLASNPIIRMKNVDSYNVQYCNKHMTMLSNITNQNFCSGNKLKSMPLEKAVKITNFTTNMLEQILEEVGLRTSAVIELLLYNPKNNLYSMVSLQMQFHSKYGIMTGKSQRTVTTIMFDDTAALTLRSKCTQSAFFVSQIVALVWILFYLSKFLFWLMQYSMKLFQTYTCRKQGDIEGKKFALDNVYDSLFTILTTLLFLIVLLLSMNIRYITESILPLSEQFLHTEPILIESFEEISVYSVGLYTTVGLIVFNACVRFLYLLNIQCIFTKPKITEFWRYYRRIVVLSFIMIILHSLIGYLIFGSNQHYSTPSRAIASTMLLSVSLGILCGQATQNLRELAQSSGYVLTFVYFFALMIIFRIALKAIIIASLSKLKHKESKKKSSTNLGNKKKRSLVERRKSFLRSHGTDSISFSTLLNHNLNKLKSCFWLLYAEAFDQNLNLSQLKNNIDLKFSNIGKKSISEYQRRKLGYASSEMTQFTGVMEDSSSMVEEWKTNDSRYDLPTEIWLEEIELQLDELYSRASALFDSSANVKRSRLQKKHSIKSVTSIESKITLSPNINSSRRSIHSHGICYAQTKPMFQNQISGNDSLSTRKDSVNTDSDVFDHYRSHRKRNYEEKSSTRVQEDTSLSSIDHPPLTTRNIAKHNHRLSSHGKSLPSSEKSSGMRTSHRTHTEVVALSYKNERKSVGNESTGIAPKVLKSFRALKNKVRQSELNGQKKAKKKPLRRSRTAGVNLKDLPKFPSLVDTSPSSDKWCERSKFTKCTEVDEEAKRKHRVRSQQTIYNQSSSFEDSSESYITARSPSLHGVMPNKQEDDYRMLPGNVSDKL